MLYNDELHSNPYLLHTGKFKSDVLRQAKCSESFSPIVCMEYESYTFV